MKEFRIISACTSDNPNPIYDMGYKFDFKFEKEYNEEYIHDHRSYNVIEDLNTELYSSCVADLCEDENGHLYGVVYKWNGEKSVPAVWQRVKKWNS